ncbi:MAG: glycosyl hydrolase 53 family protein [Bacteroidaceae bacterium]|nr:glycosyl hydrolase 53 family protein [Bacteroidaceae bacterium]
MKRFILMAGLTCIWLMSWAQESAKSDYVSDQIIRQKVIDNGGTGNYRAVVVTEKTLENFTVYRPRNVKAAARREGLLPLLIWCNGACSDNSKGYERMLNEMASHGYLVVAIGKMKVNDDDREDGGSNEKQVVEAIDWVVKQVGLKTSDYYKAVDVNNVAAAGHSCGGAQAIANCANTRMKTLLIMNAGMGGMSMGGASPQSLKQLHCPLIYMTGGPDDVAYNNAKSDFGSITKVPVVWADLSTAGHGGTYWDPQGGEFGRVALKWMDWHLKGYSQNANIFLKPSETKVFPKWKIQNKNFGKVDYDNIYATPLTVGDPAFDRQAAEETFAFGADVSFLTQQTNKGLTFLNRQGMKKDVISILKEEGMNCVRLGMLVSPSDGVCNLTYTRNLAKKAKDQDMNIMLCLHYTDNRTDIGSQQKPSAWKNHDIDALVSDVKTHTSTAVRTTQGSSDKLKWVQVGYQLDEGMLWPEGRLTSGGTNVENFARLFNAAYDAVKEVNPDIQVVLHLADLQGTSAMNNYFDALVAAGVKWDVIGLSAYPLMTGLGTEVLAKRTTTIVKSLKERYGKPVMIVETGYYNDQPLATNHFLCDLMQQLIDAGAAGCFYWEPELTDGYNMGAWNPETRQVSVALEAFRGLKHTEVPYLMDIAWASDMNSPYVSAPIELPVNARHIRDRIEKVELMEGQEIYATSTEPPYTLVWNNPEPGTHSIFAQATATDGETASTDVVNIEVSANISAVDAVKASNDIQLKASKNKVAVESATPLRYIRIYSVSGMKLAEKKVNGSHRASLSIDARRGTLLLIQVETEVGSKTFHLRM